jgi:cellulose synthase/poly-beta-1,6-N-acetylglucosamine synthase-like glycosyltransferase/Flp pilus assembly protein TadD
MSQRKRQALMALCGLVTMAYLLYRGFYTLNYEGWYGTLASWLLYGAEIWGGVSLLLFFLQIWDTSEPADERPLEGVTVDVLVPTYNEEVSLLRGTLQACLAMDYPHRLYLLDDGKRDEVRQLCEELGVHYITRSEHLHAKAGNLNHALDQTDGEFVAILDADHVPEPHFLSKMIGYFRDRKLGFVQSPHAFSNFDTFQGRVNYEKGRFWDEGELFYKVIQPGRNATDSVVFAGSAALFRREALKEVGYIATETITEDMHTGLRMASRGWGSKFVSERLVAGQGAADVTTFHSQRLRWAEGNLSILAHDNPLFMRGLTLRQRLCYFGSIIHWASGFPRLAMYLTPILMLLTGISPVKEFTLVLAGVFTVYISLMLITLHVLYRGFMTYGLVEFFNMANFWTQIRATTRALLYREKSKFVVTNKAGGAQGSIMPVILPQIMLLTLCQFSLIYGWSRNMLFEPQLNLLGLGIATFLVLHHAYFAMAYLRVAMTPISKRASYRHRLNMPVRYSFTDSEGESFEGMGVTTDLNELGLGFVAYEELPGAQDGLVTVLASNDRLQAPGKLRLMDKANLDVAAEPAAAGHTLHRYGVEFQDPSPESIDAAARITQRFAVAPWFSVFDRQRTKKGISNLLSKREVKRVPFKLPLRLESPEGDVYCSTRDLSSKSMRCIVATDIAEGSSLRAEVYGPVGSFEVQVYVSSSREVTGPPHLVREYVLEFDSFEAQGRSMLRSLLELDNEPSARRDLVVEHGEKRKPFLRPAAVSSFAVLALAPVAVGVFQEIHSDDFLLLQSIETENLADPAGLHGQNLDRILAETLASPNPEEQRLILLKEALEREGRHGEQIRVCRFLTSRRPDDPDMGMALVAALTLGGNHEESSELSSRWITRLSGTGQGPALREFELLAARNHMRNGEQLVALEGFRRLVADRPQEAKVGREYAWALLQSGLSEEALRINSQLPQDKETRRQLVAIHSSLGNFKDAEVIVRSLASDEPLDLNLQVELANLLVWQEDYAGATRTYRRLLTMHPTNSEISLALGEVLTWSGNADEALQHFGGLIDRGAQGDRLTGAFLDAMLGAENPSTGDVHRLRVMLDHHVNREPYSSNFAIRLGLAVVRVGPTSEGIEVLESELTKTPANQELRLNLADALATHGQNERAQHHYRFLLASARK